MSMCLAPVLATDSVVSLVPDMVVLVGENAVATELLNTPRMLAEALMTCVTLPMSLVCERRTADGPTIRFTYALTRLPPPFQSCV